jgi:hypothetical protein
MSQRAGKSYTGLLITGLVVLAAGIVFGRFANDGMDNVVRLALVPGIALVLLAIVLRRRARNAPIAAASVPAASAIQGGAATLYPVLRDMSWHGRATTVGRPMLQRTPAGAHNVWISYAYDTGHQLASVTSDGSHGEPEALARLALQNLARRPLRWKVQLEHDDGRPRVLVCQDEYAAEGILVPDLMREAHLYLETDTIAVALYARGGMMAQDATDAAAVMELADLCRAQYDRADGSRVSPVPLLVTDAQVVGFVAPVAPGQAPARAVERRV